MTYDVINDVATHVAKMGCVRVMPWFDAFKEVRRDVKIGRKMTARARRSLKTLKRPDFHVQCDIVETAIGVEISISICSSRRVVLGGGDDIRYLSFQGRSFAERRILSLQQARIARSKARNNDS